MTNVIDEISVVLQVGEDLEEYFERELENYEIQVRGTMPDQTNKDKARTLTSASLGFQVSLGCQSFISLSV